LVDFDGDGRTDILSGSFTGELFLFHRNEDGRFAEAQLLEHSGGQPIKLSYNGTAFAYDWDADGDLDLVARGYRLEICLIANEGSREKPIFAEPQAIQVDGKSIRGKSPCMADWDGDGKDDLLTCSGRVLWYRNTGEKGKPVFQPPVTLVPTSDHQSVKRRHDEPFRLPETPGHFNSICVVDFNGDGRLDLLVGDTFSENVELPELTAEQQATKDERNAKLQAVYRERRDLQDSPENESRQARAERRRKYLAKWKEMAAARDAVCELHRPQSNRYGCVWLFERTPSRPRTDR
jgi:hypothetical protein